MSAKPEEHLPAPEPRTLWDFERALVETMDELSDLIPPDGEAETDEMRDRRVDIEGRLTQLIQRETDKVDATYRLFKRLDRYVEELESDAKGIAARIKKFSGDRKRLASYLIDVMIAWGAKKLEGKQGTLTRIQNVDTVDVEDANAIPFEFQRWEFTFKPRNTEQLAELRELTNRIEARFSVEADKPALKKLVGDYERQVAEVLAAGGSAPDAIVKVPDGVSLKPGTWRLAVKP